MKITLKKLADGGLYLSGPADTLPEGFARRYRGISPISENSVKSRLGSAQLYNLNAHSLTYFADSWYLGVTTILYQATTSIRTGLSGDKLSFATMPPTAGIPDYLFVAGGGELFKVDSDGNDTEWGIAPPDTPTVADGGGGGNLDDGAVYKYALTFLNSATGTRSNPSSRDPVAIDANTVVLMHYEAADGSSLMENSISGGPAFTAQNSAQVDSIRRYFGATALRCLEATSDYISAPDDADFYLSGDFTISFWQWLPSTLESKGIFQQYQDADNCAFMKLDLSGSNYTMRFSVRSGGASIALLEYTNDTSFWRFNFHLLTVTRNGNDWRMYLDGVVVDSTSNANAYPNLTAAFEIGRSSYGGITYGSKWIDEFIIVKGTDLYQGDFTPPTNAFGSASEIDLAGGSTSVDLSNLPSSSDSQADFLEIWRTTGDGSIYFRLIKLAEGTTTYTDNISDDDLESLELPIDNFKPYSWFDDCYGPYNASMFWITRTQEGERGRVYYSPIGRAEAIQGFIEVTSDDDELQRIIGYAGQVFAISKTRVFQIFGTNPYSYREIPGVPGTSYPHTVAITPFGPMWQASDGVRIFTGGAQSKLVNYNAVKPVFRGETVGAFNVWATANESVAAFARGEYIISDTNQTLAVNLETLKWRDIGIGIDAIFYSQATDQIAANFQTQNYVIDFEKVGEDDDNGNAMRFDYETGHINFVPPAAIELIRVDADANTEVITCYAHLDDSAETPGNLTSTAGRRFSEFAMDARLVNRLGIQLIADIDNEVEIHSIEVEYWPMELSLIVDGAPRKIPGRLSGDSQTLTFEAFSDTQDSPQAPYIFDRLFYDLNTGSENVVFTLHLINESNVALGTINNAVRAVDEINITKTGRFEKLTLAGDFTTAIKLRRLELTASIARR